MQEFRINNILQNLPIISKFFSRRNKKTIIKNRKIDLQKYGLDMLKMVDTVLTDNKIMYFADFGTLLGIVRENGFIKHDLDMDFGILESEGFSWDKLEKLMVANNLRKVRQFVYRGIVTEQTYCFENLTIDFFLHFREGEFDVAYEYFKRKKYPYEYANQFHVAKWMMYKFQRTERRVVNGVEINVPCESEKYLESIYSKTWKIPNANWKSSDGQGWNELDNEFATMIEFDKC